MVNNRAYVVDLKDRLGWWRGSTRVGGRLFVRCFDGAGNIRENTGVDMLASIATKLWNGPAKGWNAGTVTDDANLSWRGTLRLGAGVAFAQVGIVGFDGAIELEALRLYGLPESASGSLNGTPTLPESGQHEYAAEDSWDLRSLGPGATAKMDGAAVSAPS